MKKSSNKYKLDQVLINLHQIWVKLYLTYLFIEKNFHVLYDDFLKSQFGVLPISRQESLIGEIYGQDNRP